MKRTKLHEKADFTNKNIYVGIDTHKKDWNISLLYEKDYLKSFTQPPSAEALEKFLRREYPGANYYCGYEAGFFGFSIQRQLSSKGISCIVVHPADIPHTGKEKTIKRDATDSKKIAMALATNRAVAIHVPADMTEQDRSLVRYRVRLQRDITRLKSRIKSILFQFGISIPPNYGNSWSKNFVNWLVGIERIEGFARITLNHMIDQFQRLRELLLKVNSDLRALQRSARYRRPIELLMSIPGVGPITALTFLTEIENIKRFSNFRQLNSFVGFYPMEYSSGEYDHKGKITIRKNAHLRRLLVESSWTAVRLDPAMTQVYQEWKLRMTGKRAIIKIARKLLSRMRYVLIHETEYVRGIVR
jgi:transposase